MKKLLFIAFFSVGHLAAQTQTCYYDDRRGAARGHSVDYHHLDLDLEVFPFEQKVEGTVTLTFQPLRPLVDSLWIDAPKMTIKSVKQNNRLMVFAQNIDGFFVMADAPWERGRTYQLEIRYEANPRKGLYFSGWIDGSLDGQVWSQGQGIDNRHWIPHFDALNNKLTTDITVRFDSAYQVISNGALAEKKQLPNGKTQWRWVMDKPHSSYLIMLAIGNFKYFDSQSQSGVPIRQYYYPEWEDNKGWVYKHTEGIMDWLESETQTTYPWVNYKQVPIRDFIYGAMENTTATIFKDAFYTDSIHFDFRNYLFVNTHEMAHQWFGNLVTAWSPQHHWLQESFATYYHQKVQEEFLSPDQYDHERYQSALIAKYANLNNPRPLANGDAGTARHYQKGSLVLTMLEDWVGPDLFRASIAYYLNRHAFDNARSKNLMDAFHRVTGYSMDAFWDNWVFRPGEPYLTVDVNKVEGKPKTQGYWLIFSQDSSKLADKRLFSLPINYEVHTGKNEIFKRTFLLSEEKDSVFVQGDIQYIIIDPRRILLGHWKMNLPNAWWHKQYINADFAIDRKMAFQECEDCMLSPQIIDNESFGPLRANWLSIFSQDTVLAESDLARWTHDAHFAVRKRAYSAALNHSGNTPKKWLQEGLSDPHEEVRSFCLTRFIPLATPQEALIELEKISPKNQYDMGIFRFNWYRAMLLQFDPGREGNLRGEIESYLSAKYPADWRLEAIEIVNEYEWWSDKNLFHLLDGFVHYDRKYRNVCENIWNKLYSEDHERMDRILDEFLKDATVQQKERLEKLRGHG
ncbi:MAG: M1 family metallopeptidase [Cryomorphaceae bacterium]|nr:M1 family metallopeptidase [Cryomorphaceae bacterium]